MTAREAIRLTKKMGGRFVRHGAKHDIFANAAGEEFPIPPASRRSFTRGRASHQRKARASLILHPIERKRPMKFLYEAILTPWSGGWEAEFPDLGICTQGDTLFDAAFMAQDLLTLWISQALREGRPLPEPRMDHPAPRKRQGHRRCRGMRCRHAFPHHHDRPRSGGYPRCQHLAHTRHDSRRHSENRESWQRPPCVSRRCHRLFQ